MPTHAEMNKAAVVYAEMHLEDLRAKYKVASEKEKKDLNDRGNFARNMLLILKDGKASE